jgi:hypothetical protein
MPQERTPGLIVQVALAEFNALRGEISGRASLAWTLVNLNLTVTTTIVGLALSATGIWGMLLVLPLLSPAFGLLFIDHSLNIKKLGKYIQEHLGPILVREAGDDQLFQYEDWVDEYETRWVLRWVPFGIPLLLLFAGFPLVALVLTYPTALLAVHPMLKPAFAWGLWGLGVLLATTTLLLFVIFLAWPNPFERRSRRRRKAR